MRLVVVEKPSLLSISDFLNQIFPSFHGKAVFYSNTYFGLGWIDQCIVVNIRKE